MPDDVVADERHDLDYYAAVPYLLVIESVEREGQWLRRAEYPELPGCAAEADSAVEAIARVERQRLAVLRRLWDRGAPIPVPRPPLRGPLWARGPAKSASDLGE